MRLSVTLLCLTLASTSVVQAQESAFVESDPAIHFKNRNLLQDDAENDLGGGEGQGHGGEATKEASRYTTEIQEGPELFYDGKDFLMKVRSEEKKLVQLNLPC